MNTIPGGLLVVIEGIDGAGKTTQASMLAQHFGQVGYPVIMSKEPTNRQWGAKLRESAEKGRLSLEEEKKLFLLDRREHVSEVIKPALLEGLIVILDRYFYSTAAYQSKTTGDVDPIIAANEEFAPQPDRLFVLDVSPECGIDRIRKRGDLPNSFESEGQLTHAREVFRNISEPFVRVIDGSQTVSRIHREIVNHTLKAAMNKIAQEEGISEDGLNSTLTLFGGDPRAHNQSARP